MRSTTETTIKTGNRLFLRQAALVYCALMHLLPGLALLLLPQNFYTIADFPPFNRHYMGDAGVFSFAIGLGLLLAVRQINQNGLLIGAAAVGNALHVLNHLYDDLLVDGGNLDHLLTNTLPLLVVTLLLIWLWAGTLRRTG
jgi:hypothetical protein